MPGLPPVELRRSALSPRPGASPCVWRLSGCATSATESLSGERPPCQLVQALAQRFPAAAPRARCRAAPPPAAMATRGPRGAALGPEAAAQVAPPGRRGSSRLGAFPPPPPSLGASTMHCGRRGVALADSLAFTCKDSSSQWSGPRPLPRPPCHAVPVRRASQGGGFCFLVEHSSLQGCRSPLPVLTSGFSVLLSFLPGTLQGPRQMW